MMEQVRCWLTTEESPTVWMLMVTVDDGLQGREQKRKGEKKKKKDRNVVQHST